MNTSNCESSQVWYKKWSKETGLILMDCDGWSQPFSASWDELISYEEFLDRVKNSSVGVECGEEE